jgi:putative heme-binding domain-containing protein
VAALELIDGTQRPDEFHGEQYAAKVFNDSDSSDAMRRLALHLLRPDHPALSVERLKSLLDSSDLALKREAIEALRATTHGDRFAALATVARDEKCPADLRAAAVVGLAEADGQRDLLLKLAAGGDAGLRAEALRSLRGTKPSDAEKAALEKLAAKDAATAELVGRILAPPAPVNPPRHDVEAWLKKLDGPADPVAGERIFFQPKAAGCYRCHEMHGRGGRIGPELTAAARTLGRQRLVESIVDPSKEIAPRFVPWSLELKDGRTVSGMLVTEDQGGVQTYADDTGKLFKLRPDEIADRRTLTTSIMPEGLADMLTPQEFRDLIAFLLAEERK